jgi:hypothetical protein
MKMKTLGLALLLSMLAVPICLAADNPNMGTWKLNEAKSKLDPNGPKNQTVVYSMAGEQWKVTVEGVDAKGKALRSEWTGSFDGKDQPVTGSSGEDTRAYKKIDDRTLEFTSKKDGKVTTSGTVAVSADGRTRTVTHKGTSTDGKAFSSTVVYDKQ